MPPRSKSDTLTATQAIGCAAAFIGLVALFLLVISLTIAWGSLRDVQRQAARMATSESVTATVVASGTQRQMISGSSSSRGRPTYLPTVRFEFTRAGRTYTSEHVFPVPRSGDEAWATAIAARFPAESTTTAWVPPDEPEAAYLVREWVAGPYAGLVVAGISIAILALIVGIATSPFTPICRAVVAIGVVGSLTLTAAAATHFLTHVGLAGRGAGPVVLGAGGVVAAGLPLLALVVSARWKRSLASAR